MRNCVDDYSLMLAGVYFNSNNRAVKTEKHFINYEEFRFMSRLSITSFHSGKTLFRHQYDQSLYTPLMGHEISLDKTR